MYTLIRIISAAAIRLWSRERPSSPSHEPKKKRGTRWLSLDIIPKESIDTELPGRKEKTYPEGEINKNNRNHPIARVLDVVFYSRYLSKESKIAKREKKTLRKN